MTVAKPFPKLLAGLPVLLGLLLTGMYFYGLRLDPNAGQSRLLGKPVPSFSLPGLADGSKVLQSAGIKGPAVLNVWASWCAACREEHRQLLRIGREEGIAVYGVAYQDERQSALAWLKQQGDPFTWVMFDGAAQTAQVLDIFSLPQTYLVDAKGIIRARHIGLLTPSVWQRMQEQLLSGDSLAAAHE